MIVLMGMFVFAGAFSVEDKAQRPTGSGKTGIGIRPVDGHCMVSQQVAGFCGAGDFLTGLVLSEIHDTLRKPKRLRSFMRTHSIQVRSSKVAHASIFLVHGIERHPHGYGVAGLQHEVMAILMGWSGLAYARRFVEVL